MLSVPNGHRADHHLPLSRMVWLQDRLVLSFSSRGYRISGVNRIDDNRARDEAP